MSEPFVPPADAFAAAEATRLRHEAEAKARFEAMLAAALAGDHVPAERPTRRREAPITLTAAADVTDAIAAEVIDIADSHLTDDEAPIDWEEWWNVLDRYGLNIEDPDAPAARKIQRIVRQWRREGE